MNKLDQINKRIRYYVDDFPGGQLAIEILATLVELGDYVIRYNYWTMGNYYSDEHDSMLTAHNEFLELSKRVDALVATHGEKPYSD